MLISLDYSEQLQTSWKTLISAPLTLLKHQIHNVYLFIWSFGLLSHLLLLPVEN